MEEEINEETMEKIEEVCKAQKEEPFDKCVEKLKEEVKKERK